MIHENFLPLYPIRIQLISTPPLLLMASKTKYIFITGGVTSSLGKGIIAASLVMGLCLIAAEVEAQICCGHRVLPRGAGGWISPIWIVTNPSPVATCGAPGFPGDRREKGVSWCRSSAVSRGGPGRARARCRAGWRCRPPGCTRGRRRRRGARAGGRRSGRPCRGPRGRR